MPAVSALEGKPFYIKLDGRQRNIGEITGVAVTKNRRTLQVTVELTDEEVAGMIGASAEKDQEASDLHEDAGVVGVPVKALPELL